MKEKSHRAKSNNLVRCKNTQDKLETCPHKVRAAGGRDSAVRGKNSSNSRSHLTAGQINNVSASGHQLT